VRDSSVLMFMAEPRSITLDRVPPVLRLAGAGLLVATGAIHLDLYLTGYRSIPTIGWLFALQVLTAFGLATAIALTRSWTAAAAGAAFAGSTLAGYFLSVWVGFFGFQEVQTTAGIGAGVIEMVAVIVLTTNAVARLCESRRVIERTRQVNFDTHLAAGVLAVSSLLAIALFGASTAVAAGAPTLATGGIAHLTSRDVGNTTVLTDARGLTLYWFAPDTTTMSKCTGSCTAYWPPVTGAPKLAPGLRGTIGTILRSGAVLQPTYNGHPLYTYIGDSDPGQTAGNDLNLNGGIWHEMNAST
jgi:predicted lipoprotein with Yx(FWY)xxD motif